MKYISTRGQDSVPNFENVVTAGLARDGGLYVPEHWYRFTHDEIAQMIDLPYTELLVKIAKTFVGGCLTEDELRQLAEQTYLTGNFRHSAIAPLKQFSHNEYMLELFHGPTLAFKDFALQFIGKLLDHFLQKSGKKITIIGATSGDTGSAAIAGCLGCQNMRIFVMHPKGKVTDVQRRQMTTIDAPNVFNIAVEGTFDDCQNNVKSLFSDLEFRDSQNLVAVNSINWARIMAQVVYYFYSSLALGAPYRRISYSVPTGNFGDVFAGYVARKMGLPIDRLIIATNKNDILHRFMKDGVYEKFGVHSTITPSMDIQISSNFERLLYDVYEHNGDRLREMMDNFGKTNRLEVENDILDEIRMRFGSQRVDEEQTLQTMREIYNETGEIIDPHTAVGVYAARKAHDKIRTPIVTLSTAHPAKFPDAVKRAIGIKPELPTHMSDLFDLPEKYEVMSSDVKELEAYIKAN